MFEVFLCIHSCVWSFVACCKIVEPKVTMRKRKANPETSEPPKKEASKQKKQGASSRAKKRAKKMEDVEEEDDEMNGVTAVKEDSKAPVSVIVTKMTDKTSPSDDINQDKGSLINQ